MDAFISSCPPLTRSVDGAVQRARPRHDERPVRTTTLGQWTEDSRYTSHLMGHLCNLCASFRLDRKCKSPIPLCRIRRKTRPWNGFMALSLRWKRPICCTAIEWSLLKAQSVIRIELLTFSRYAKVWRAILCTNSGYRFGSCTYVTTWVIMIDVRYNSPWLVNGRCRPNRSNYPCLSINKLLKI